MAMLAVVGRSLVNPAHSCLSRMTQSRLRSVLCSNYRRKCSTHYKFVAREPYPVMMSAGSILSRMMPHTQMFPAYCGNNIITRYFKTSATQQGLPPMFLVVLRPLSKLVAMLFGRSLRLWWKKLPMNKRQFLLDMLIRHRFRILGIAAPIGGGVYYFYISHLETDPITKRERFIAFSDDQVVTLAKIEQNVVLEKYRGQVLPPTHPVYKQVSTVAMHILESNKDIEKVRETNWSLIVIDSIEDKNAFVLPNGTIFIFTGMLSVCSSVDQLGIVISHEIAHVLLSHMAEQMSRVNFHEFLMIAPIVVLWALFPDSVAIFSQWLSNVFVKTLIHLPFSRSVESEADGVGLQLAAKACLDVREASVFWEKMKKVSESESGEAIEFLSTHPAYDTRKKFLDAQVPEALKLREKCHCPKLSPIDPRSLLKIEGLQKKI